MTEKTLEKTVGELEAEAARAAEKAAAAREVADERRWRDLEEQSRRLRAYDERWLAGAGELMRSLEAAEGEAETMAVQAAIDSDVGRAIVAAVRAQNMRWNVGQQIANVRPRLGLPEIPAATIVERSPATLLGAIGRGLVAEVHRQVDEELARGNEEREAAGRI